MDALSLRLCKQCRDEKCCVHVVMRGQGTNEVQCPVTEDGSNWKLEVDVKKMKEVAARSARGRKKTRLGATEDGETNESDRGDVSVETSKGAGWMADSSLNPGLVRDAKEKGAVIGLFLQFKKKDDKSKSNDISAQGGRIQVILGSKGKSID